MESYTSTCIKSRRCKFESYFFDRRRCHNSSCIQVSSSGNFQAYYLIHSSTVFWATILMHSIISCSFGGVYSFATIKNMSPLKRALSIPHFIANKIVKVTFAIAIHFIFSHLTSLSLFKLHFIDFFPLFSYPVDTGSRQSRVRKKGEFYVSK